jgi:hypothetical protein
MYRPLFTFVALIGLSGCAGTGGRLVTPDAIDIGGNLFVETLEDGGQIVVLDGEITEETSFVFNNLVEHSEKVGSLVVAQSPGGNVFASQQIGRAVQRSGSSVLVIADCLSACMNILIAGKSRVLDEFAVLGLHSSNAGAEGLADEERYWESFGFGHIIRAAYKVPHSDMWFIGAERALELRLATELVAHEE